MPHLIRAACMCSIGKVRRNNEDNFLFDGTTLEEDNRGLPAPITFSGFTLRPRLFGVFDGMGGEAFGETASYTAAQYARQIAAGPVQPPDLSQACLDINRAVFLRSQDLLTAHMGATLAMLCFSGNRVTLCNLGDSRIFRLRNGALTQISQDHTDEAYRKQRGISGKPHLIQYLGIDPEETLIEPWVTEDTLRRKDTYLICSDGLTDMVDNEQIAVLLASGSPGHAAAELTNAALRSGGRDNITVIVIRII